MRSQKERRRSQGGHEELRVGGEARRSQEKPGAARRSQEQPGARRSQGKPGRARGSQEGPGGASPGVLLKGIQEESRRSQGPYKGGLIRPYQGGQ